jgi:hypothetical protein
MNGGNDRETIRQWLESEFAAVEESGAVAIIGMVHHAHSGPAQLHAMKVGHSKWGDADAMAHTFDSIASRHARGVSSGGAQQYELSICRGSDGRPTTVLPFVRVGSPNITGPSGSLATEPPTTVGQVQQGMRQAELVVQGMLGQIHPTFRVQGDLIDKLMKRLSEVDQENRELWVAAKGLLMELMKEKHADKMRELMAARMTEFAKHVMRLAPALLNMMTGREVFPLSPADTGILDTIAALATPEDVRALSAVLMTKGDEGAALATVLTDRFSTYHKRRKEEETAEQRLIAGLPARSYEEAERDAAGDAMRVLRGGGGPKALPANGKSGGGSSAGLAKTNGNGHADVSTTPTSPGSEGDQLWQDVFNQVPADMIHMLASGLGTQDPELSKRVLAAYEASKKKADG